MGERIQVAMVMVRQESANNGFSIHFVLSGGCYFHSVAGGKNHPLADTLAMHEIGQGCGDSVSRDVHLLPNLHRCRAMVDAQKGEIHFETRDSGIGTRDTEKSNILVSNHKSLAPQPRDVPVLPAQQTDSDKRYQNGREPDDRDVGSAPPTPSAADPCGEQDQID